jgi:hypothetical protein
VVVRHDEKNVGTLLSTDHARSDPYQTCQSNSKAHFFVSQS